MRRRTVTVRALPPEKVEALCAAWVDEGINPGFHRMRKRQLEQHWPVLYRAMVQAFGP